MHTDNEGSPDNGKSDDPAENPYDWSGEAGRRWLERLDLYEGMIEPIGTALIERAGFAPGERVADIGCGGGWTSRQIARIVGDGGQVIGLDLSPDLVAEAEERARQARLNMLHFQQGDATIVTPADAPFDRIFSRFGVMFFADAHAAFTNLHRLLRKGGRLDMAVWAPLVSNPWQRDVMLIISNHIDLPDQEPDAPGPFSLAEQDRVTEILTAAGFTDIDFGSWSGKLLIGGPESSPDTAADFTLGGINISELIHQQKPGTEAILRHDLLKLYARHQGADGISMAAKAWLISARA